MCEGYLEVVKLARGKNPTVEEDLDPYLSKYCENVISQSFNSPDTPKNKNSPVNILKNMMSVKSRTVSTNHKKFHDGFETSKFKKNQHHYADDNKINNNELNSSVDYYMKSNEKFNGNSLKNSDVVNFKNVHDDVKSYEGKDNSNKNSKKDNSELYTKGMPKEQVDLLNALRKEKTALLSWLFDNKENDYTPQKVKISVNGCKDGNSSTSSPRNFLSGTFT